MYSLFLTPSIMIPYQNPTIYLGTLRIDEPVSAVTDIIMCSVCFYAFYKTKALEAYKPVSLYRWFFLFTGLSTLVAAIIGHAFLYYFGANAKIYGWLFGIAGTTFAQFAAMYNTRKLIGEPVFKRLILINGIEVIAAFILVFITWSFVVVEVHTAYGLLLNVVVLESINYKKTESVLSIKVIYGIGIAVVAVLCHIFQFACSVWFNHIDLSHVFMALSMYVIYKGISLYEETKPKLKSV
jgi:uncharacterized protein DUF6962